MPDVNYGGKVHGGTVMKWIDEAGYACATSWARRYCITVYVGGIRFHRPIMIGDLVEVGGRLAYTGTTSMALAIEVHAHDLSSQQPRLVTHCVAVYVAVDEDDKPTPVDTWHPATPGDIALAQRVKGLITAARAAQ